MPHRKALLNRKAHYETLISMNLMEVQYWKERGCTVAHHHYRSGRSFMAAHLEISKLLNKY